MSVIDLLASSIPTNLLDYSGLVFYSGRNAFEAPSSIYILGVNPGGDPDLQASETIRRHTNHILTKEKANWSAYRDDSWCGKKPGTWGMQPRVLHVLGRLGLDPGVVPASNVVFVRSKREEDLRRDYANLAEACWPFHSAVLSHVRPRVILCFGQTPGRFVRRKIDADQLIGEFVEANNRRWRSRAFANSHGVVVVVATHPSIADWTSKAADPTVLIERALSVAG